MGLTTPKLDHLAIGVRRWSDSYRRFIVELGGRWVRGGPGPEFEPYQLEYGDCLQLEFVAPRGSAGFMHRFLERNGPSAHHITFKVPSIGATLDDLGRLGYESFGGRPDLPMWREAFVHPKLTGLGTLLQVVESDDEVIAQELVESGRPADLPDPTVPPRTVALFGLTVGDLQRAHDLFTQALYGSVLEKGTGWFLVGWGPGRSVLVREGDVTPGGGRLWARTPAAGPAFVLFGPADATVAMVTTVGSRLLPMPHDETTVVPVWLM